MKKILFFSSLLISSIMQLNGQIPNLHIEGNNPIVTIEALTDNAKLQFTDNFTTTTDDWVIVFDKNDNGQLKWRNNNVSMMTLSNTGMLGLGTTIPETKLHIKGGPDATLAAGTGFIQLGSTDGVNMVIDNNEIQVRNNGAANTLNLNLDGGEVHIGRHSTNADVKLRGTLEATSLVGVGDRNVYADANGELKSGPQLHYLSLPASAFHPSSDQNDIGWRATDQSAFYSTAPPDNRGMIAPLMLPHKSTITSVTVHYSDFDNSNSVQFLIKRFIKGAGIEEFAVLTSADSPSPAISTTTNIPVDNSIETYSFEMRPQSGTSGYMDSDFQVHQVIIEYFN